MPNTLFYLLARIIPRLPEPLQARLHAAVGTLVSALCDAHPDSEELI